jgi:hypothetical protein
MKNSIRLKLKQIGVISFFALQGLSMWGSVQTTCYSTPRSAVDALTVNPSISEGPENVGYRVSRIESDPVLRTRWAMIVSCDHPEWPAFALSTNATKSIPTHQESGHSLATSVKAVPVVRAGEVVRLWRQENFLRIEVAGVSEESGGLGKTIRVRLLRRSTDDQSVLEQFSGVVRGPSDVEMELR